MGEKKVTFSDINDEQGMCLYFNHAKFLYFSYPASYLELKSFNFKAVFKMEKTLEFS
jgi:hypothetical protein